MRDQPLRIDAVPGETARELVVHATGSHRREGALDHRQRRFLTCAGVVAQQEFVHHRLRELRRPAESAESGVEGRAQRRQGAIDDLAVDSANLG